MTKLNDLVAAKAVLLSEYFTDRNEILKTDWDSESLDRKLNKRKFKNKEAVRWAFREGFLCTNQNERNWVMDWSMNIYAKRWPVPDIERIEVEVLWEILKDAIKAHSGRSIITHSAWENLGINPHGDRYHTEADYQKQWRIIAKLAHHGYIWFQSCGDLWRIEIKQAIAA
jgi:hypothetical protein